MQVEIVSDKEFERELHKKLGVQTEKQPQPTINENLRRTMVQRCLYDDARAEVVTCEKTIATLQEDNQSLTE